VDSKNLERIHQYNRLLQQHQEQLNQQKNIPTLSSFLHNGPGPDFPGAEENISVILDRRKNLLLEKHAILGDVLFILHDAIQVFLTSELAEQERIEIIKILEDNKLMIEQRILLLSKLGRIYASCIIEPGRIAITDGEKLDPTHFRIFIDPTTNLSPEAAQALLGSWQSQLLELETQLTHTLQLHFLPNYTVSIT